MRATRLRRMTDMMAVLLGITLLVYFGVPSSIRVAAAENKEAEPPPTDAADGQVKKDIGERHDEAGQSEKPDHQQLDFVTKLPGATLCLGSSRYRHAGTIGYAVMAPDEHTLYTLSNLGVYAWDLNTGESRFLFNGDRIRNALSVSPDGKRLTSIVRDEVAIWDAQTGKVIDRLEESFSAGCAAFRPDGNGLIICRENHIEYRSPDGVAQTVGNVARFRREAFSPDGKWFAAWAAADNDRDLIVFDMLKLRTRATLPVGPAGFGYSRDGGLDRIRAGFSPDGKLLVVPAADGSVRVWDIDAGKETRTLKPSKAAWEKDEREFFKLLVSADGKRLFVGTATGTIRRWDMESGEELTPLRSHRQGITSLLLANGGKHLVSICGGGDIRRWESLTGREIEPPDGYHGGVRAELSADRQASVLLLDGTGRIDIRDLRTGKLLMRGQSPAKAVVDFGFLPNGKQLFFAESSGRIHLCDATSGQLVRSIELAGYVGRFKELRFCKCTADSRSFVVNQDAARIACIDVATGRKTWVSKDLSSRGRCFAPAITPDGKALLLGVITYEEKPYSELRGTLELVRLDVASGMVIDRTKVESSSRGDLSWFEPAQITPDGRTLLLNYGMTEISFADAESNRILHRYASFILPCTLSPDGKWFMGQFTQDVRVSETLTGKLLFKLPLSGQTVGSIHVLSDGRHVLTSGGGGLACLWDLKPPANDTPVEAEVAWGNLGSAPAEAYRAIWQLVDNPAKAVKLLSERLPQARANREIVSRGVQVLELVNSQESRRLLEMWSSSDTSDFLTSEAKAASFRASIRDRVNRDRP